MAESTLTLTYDDLRKEVGRYLGFGATIANWSANNAALIDACVQSGLRKFYTAGHDWSFLRPTLTLVAWASIDATPTNTVTGTSADAGANTLLASTLPVFFDTMVGASITLAGVANPFTILAYVSATQVKVAGVVPSMATPKQFSMVATGDYPLPDDVGSIEGPVTFETPEPAYWIDLVGEHQVRQARQLNAARTRPRIIAQVPAKLAASQSVGQRHVFQLHPIPDVNYTLRMRYTVLPNALTDSNRYHFGGMQHADTVLASCLAVAELRGNGTVGPMANDYAARLAASVRLDQAQSAPDTLGYNGNNKGNRREPGRFAQVFVQGVLM